MDPLFEAFDQDYAVAGISAGLMALRQNGDCSARLVEVYIYPRGI